MTEEPLPSGDLLDLLDWKRRVSELYGSVRAASDRREAWEWWRDTRAELFRTHSQSPIAAARRPAFPGLAFFDYDPGYRVLARVRPAEAETYDIESSGDGSFRFTRFAMADFGLTGQRLSLECYWLAGYGGGLFLSFRDGTSGHDTYGAGRYLFDTVKGADLGIEDGKLVLDFNFAYNPSCAYDPAWVCPLTTPANRLSIRIEAGEKTPPK
ncbi:MAG TPA: DUF1684 domain-containing protein [Actinomycetota bacterium]